MTRTVNSPYPKMTSLGDSTVDVWHHAKVEVTSTPAALDAIAGHTYAEQGIVVIADGGNAGNINVASSITNIATVGFTLDAGDKIVLPVSDLTSVFAVAEQASGDFLHVFLF